MDTKRSFQSAKDVMTKKIVLVDGMATAKEAVEIMRREKAEALIVKKRHEQDAYGIVSIRDFIKGVIISDKTSEEVNGFEIMTKPVISVPADMDVRYVANLLMKVGLRMAPVRENDEYIGIHTHDDLFEIAYDDENGLLEVMYKMSNKFFSLIVNIYSSDTIEYNSIYNNQSKVTDNSKKTQPQINQNKKMLDDDFDNF